MANNLKIGKFQNGIPSILKSIHSHGRNKFFSMNQFDDDSNKQLQAFARYMQRSHTLRIDAFVLMCKYYFWLSFGQQFFLRQCEDVVITGGVSDKRKFFELCYPRNWRTFFNAVVKNIKGLEFTIIAISHEPRLKLQRISFSLHSRTARFQHRQSGGSIPRFAAQKNDARDIRNAARGDDARDK